MMAHSPDPLLHIENLSVAFPTEDGPAYAVRGLTLSLNRGEILGLVGESGCGKSLSSLAILQLIPRPGEITQGTITFDGADLTRLSEKDVRKYRGSRIAMIPQDPLTSLNPVYTIGDQIGEVIQLHLGLSDKDTRKRTIELLEQVRIPNAAERLDNYPHEFSGGMRQRVMIAMALSCNPELLIADEPTTALDVTVQAQILDLLRDIQKESETAILMITHDLGVVAEICHQVSVMYAGRIVESASVHELFQSPKHPYTQGLLNSLPSHTRKRLEPIEGHPPSLTEIPSGCSFEPRCAQRMAHCITAFPKHQQVDSDTPHTVSCYLYTSFSENGEPVVTSTTATSPR